MRKQPDPTMTSEPPDDDRTLLQPSAANPPVSGARGSGNPLPAGTLLAEFEIIGVLGEGGFGIVYVVLDRSLQRRVALKEYMPAALAARGDSRQVQVRSERHRETFELGLKSFVNEARLLAQFEHPSLVKVYRFWEANGTAYIVMPLYEGVTLKDQLKAMPQAPDEAWLMALLAPLTEALVVIHSANCFHRDIAPDNIILLAGSERPLLLDFGAARQVISDMTQALTVILKPGYAPIEQYAEVPDFKQGPWTDVYALAATVHFAITGRTPPPSVGRLMNDNFRPLAETAADSYSPQFLQAIDKALAVRPAERTQNVAAFRADLGLPPAGAVDTPVPAAAASAAGLRPAASLTAKSSKAPALAAGALLVAAAAGGFLWLRSTPEPASGPASIAPVPLASAPAAAPGPLASTPAAAPVPVRFEIRDEFAKVLAGQSADFNVQATPLKRLLRIKKDSLSFDVSSSRDGYVHVLVLGPDGSLILLFPNLRSSNNRIRAGQTLRLPQPEWSLVTAEPAGQEDLLVIVSAEPRDHLALSQERIEAFLQLPTGQRGAGQARAWTGPAPWLLGKRKPCDGAACDAYGAASFTVTIEH